MIKINRKNIWLILRSLLFVLTVIFIKVLLHINNIEFITINNLFSGIIAANVFLMGFLLSGVLTDYKESEKIPGEMAASLASIYDELLATYESKKDAQAKDGMRLVLQIAIDIEQWFHKKQTTRALLLRFRGFNSIFTELEKVIQANFIVRLKNETTVLKKLIIRTDTIRDTSFISSGYIIAQIITFLMCSGLVLSKIEPFYESLFFVSVLSFLMIFLLLLIHDLDNPFGYSEKHSAEDISLHPLLRMIEELKETNKANGLE